MHTVCYFAWDYFHMTEQSQVQVYKTYFKITNNRDLSNKSLSTWCVVLWHQSDF